MRRSALAVGLGALMAGAFGLGGAARSAEAAEDAKTIDEVIVVAQKRAERLIDVPVAVTAISADQLSQSQVTGSGQLANLSSSINFNSSTGNQFSQLRIRGVGSFSGNQGLESSSAFVVDGVGLSRQGQGIFELADIESIEVLRGPQGTLFGKGTTAGAILVNTKRPSRTFEYNGEATVAERSEARASVGVSGPFSDTVRGRLSAYYSEVGGYVFNHFDGRKLNDNQAYGARAKLEWDASENLNVLLTADFYRTDGTCCATPMRASRNPVLLQILAPVRPGPTNTEVNISGTTFNKDDQFGAVAEVNWRLGDLTLTSISGVRHWQSSASLDIDQNPAVVPVWFDPALISPGLVQTTQVDFFQFNVDLDQLSQEFRITSPSDAPLRYVAGVYAARVETDRQSPRRILGCFPIPGVVQVPGQPCRSIRGLSADGVASLTVETYAGFGQVDWSITPKLVLNVGLRAQSEKANFAGSRTGPLVPGDLASPAPAQGASDFKDSALTGKVGLQYKFADNVQSYLSYTRGYKGAGADLEIAGDFRAARFVLPETVNAYEAGLKMALAEGRVGLNLAVFRQNYTDMQVQTSTVVDNLRQFILTNAGSATSQGFEAEFALRPTQGLTLTGGYTYLDTSVDITGVNCALNLPVTILAPGTPEPTNTCVRFSTDPITATRFNLRDGKLPGSSKHRANVTGRWQQPISDNLFWFVQGAARYQSRVFYDLNQNSLTTQGGYTIIDGSAGIGTADGRYLLTVYGRNLTDRFYVSSIGTHATVSSQVNPNELFNVTTRDADRSFGITLNVRY
jgi:iron complex outermembrane receptor protein